MRSILEKCSICLFPQYPCFLCRLLETIGKDPLISGTDTVIGYIHLCPVNQIPGFDQKASFLRQQTFKIVKSFSDRWIYLTKNLSISSDGNVIHHHQDPVHRPHRDSDRPVRRSECISKRAVFCCRHPCHNAVSDKFIIPE